MQAANGAARLNLSFFLCVGAYGLALDDRVDLKATSIGASNGTVSFGDLTDSANRARGIVCVRPSHELGNTWETELPEFIPIPEALRKHYDCIDDPRDNRRFKDCSYHAQGSFLGIRSSLRCQMCSRCENCVARKGPCDSFEAGVYGEREPEELELLDAGPLLDEYFEMKKRIRREIAE